MNNAGTRPSTESMVRILALEPGSQSTRVATSNYDPVGLVAKVFILPVNKGGNICKGLYSGKELKVFSFPIIKRLRVTEIAML